MMFSDADAGEDLAALKAHYRFDQWPQRLEEHLLISNLTLSGHELPGWSLLDPQGVDDEGRPRSIESWWQPERQDTGQLVRLDIIEGDSPTDGREHLLRFVGEAQLAVAEVDSDPIGDVAFIIEEEDALFFARANLAVRLRKAARPGAPVRELGVALDGWLIDKGVVERGIPPRIESFRFADDAHPAVGRVVRLEVVATDPLDRPVSLKVFARLGELQIVEGVVTYLAVGEGTEEVTLIASSADGSTAAATLQLDISSTG